MYDKLNAFGTMCARGQSVQVAFDANMGLVRGKTGGAFVLEFTLRADGQVDLRQVYLPAGASEEGLVLSVVRGQVDIRIGQTIELSKLLRLHHGEIRHPHRAGILSFRHKGYGGQTVFELYWEAGAAPAKPVRPTAPNTPGDFIRAKNFTKLAACGAVMQVTSNLWFPVFANEDNARSFAKYVGGYARRVVPGTNTRAVACWSDKRGGYVAELSCQFPGWGVECGIVLCSGQHDVAGLALEKGNGFVLLPMKAHSHTLLTESGTLYVLFSDGTAFCRSQSDGPCALASALYFARSYTDACKVYDHGGALEVTKVPTHGFVPVYVTGRVQESGNVVHLGARSFRRGTRVASVIPA